MPTDTALKVEKVLAPYVGEFIAKAAVRKQAQAVGTDVDHLGPEHLSALSDKLAALLKSFGADAAKVADELRRT